MVLCLRDGTSMYVGYKNVVTLYWIQFLAQRLMANIYFYDTFSVCSIAKIQVGYAAAK